MLKDKLNKGNINPSEEKGSEIDIADFAKQTGLPEKFLQTKLRDAKDPTQALVETLKSDYEAEQKITEQGNLLRDQGMKLSEFAKKTVDVDKPMDVAKKTTGVDENRVEELVEVMKNATTFAKEVALGREQAKKWKEEMTINNEKSQGVTNKLMGMLLEEQYSKGYETLEARLGEETAKKYFDLEKPDSTPIGRVLSGNLEDEKEKAWAKNLRQMAFGTKKPIEVIFRNLASHEDELKYLSNPTPRTEGVGKRVQSGDTSTQEEKEFEKFMGFDKE